MAGFKLTGIFEPGTEGYLRHRRAVTLTSGVLLAGAVGGAAYLAFQAGRWGYRTLVGGGQAASVAPSQAGPQESR